jgi:FlaA1/EpsC-like NDP-sugar epimerase
VSVLSTKSIFVLRQHYARHAPWMSLIIHATLIGLAFLTSFALRFDFELTPFRVRQFATTLPLLTAIRLLVFRQFGIFRLNWRHIGLRDLFGLANAATLSSLLFVFALFFLGVLTGMPRSVLIIDWVLTIFFCGGVMYAARYLREVRPRFEPMTGRRTLLIGAGAGAELLLRQVHHDREHDLSIVGIVDDDPSTHEQMMHGVPVLGSTQDMARFVTRYRLELLVITVQHATQEQMRDLVDRCSATGVEYKILPSLTEMLTAPTPGGRLRDVRIEDLLGRKPVSLNLATVAREVTGRSILVTGAAGSIGSELARQLASFRPARLVLFDRAETPLYFVNLEITRAHPEIETVVAMADVTDADRVDRIFAGARPDFVFHAAAYKHVPMLEVNVREALRNNVLGTRRIAATAAKYGVRKVVLISTDKAVNPSSVMGATKRVAERILLASGASHPATEFRIVRFGNVLGSDGSVIPVFQRQLAARQPLTVTHPEVRRYFMTIPEAVQLVLQASLLPEAASRVAMLEMGEPVRILYLAEQMIRLSGLVPYRDVPIVFTGLRAGEKLDEELTSEVEHTIPTEVEKIRLVETEAVDVEALERQLEHIADVVASGNDCDARDALRDLVPEYWEPRPRAPFADVELPMGGREVEYADRSGAVNGRSRAYPGPLAVGDGAPHDNGRIDVARTS